MEGARLLAVLQRSGPLEPPGNATDQSQLAAESRDWPNSCEGFRTTSGEGVLEQRKNHHGVPVKLPPGRSGQLDGVGERAARCTFQNQHSRQLERRRFCIGQL
ncbi:hypothetical protein D3C84_700840 [compost metagenome]